MVSITIFVAVMQKKGRLLQMEIEKKYLVKELPDLSQFKCHEIEQGYLTRKPTLRIRKKDDKYIFTYKSKIKGSPEDINVNDEVERPLTKEAYETLREKTEGYLLHKTRYLIPIRAEYTERMEGFPDELTVELDVFHERLEGLVFAEIEFPSEAVAGHFLAPEWLGKDVSDDYRYRNGYLSELEKYEMYE